FIPPCLRVSASPVLTNFVGELVGMINQRATALAGRLSQPGSRGVADVAQFLMLQALNRWQPLLAHFNDGANLHPAALCSALCQLAGAHATFTRPTRRASPQPGYGHDALQRRFAPVIADLRRALATDLAANAVPIPLQERRHGLRVGPIVDRDLLRTA